MHRLLVRAGNLDGASVNLDELPLGSAYGWA